MNRHFLGQDFHLLDDDAFHGARNQHTDAQMRGLRITSNDVMPKRNYTIEPM